MGVIDSPLPQQPMCSVYMANYNNAMYLDVAIQSILEQTYTNWELLIIDDASTDSSKQVLKKYEGNPRIRTIYNSENRGVGYSKRRILKEAKGDLCVSLDADDTLHLQALEKLVQAYHANPDASMIFGCLLACDNTLKPIREIRQTPFKSNETVIRRFGHTGWDSFRRDAYRATGGLDPVMPHAIDQDLYAKLEEVGRLHYLAEPLYNYRQMTESVSQGQGRPKAHEWNMYAFIKAYRRRRRKAYTPNLREKEYKQLVRRYRLYRVRNGLFKWISSTTQYKSSLMLKEFFSGKTIDSLDTYKSLFNYLDKLLREDSAYNPYDKYAHEDGVISLRSAIAVEALTVVSIEKNASLLTKIKNFQELTRYGEDAETLNPFFDCYFNTLGTNGKHRTRTIPGAARANRSLCGPRETRGSTQVRWGNLWPALC